MNEKVTNFLEETGNSKEEKRQIIEIFKDKDEKCKIISESKENVTIEIIDYRDKLWILGFLMKDIEGKDVGYASFSSKDRDRIYIDINYLKTKHITDIQENFPKSTKRSLNNENFEMLAAIKIYSEFKERGLGRVLLEYAMEHLFEEGFKELYVSSDITAMDNPGEKSFYEKIGDSTKRKEADVIIDLERWYENHLKKEQ